MKTPNDECEKSMPLDEAKQEASLAAETVKAVSEMIAEAGANLVSAGTKQSPTCDANAPQLQENLAVAKNAKVRRGLTDKNKADLRAMNKVIVEEVKYNAVPLTILGTLMLIPPFMIMWAPLIVIWAATESIYRRLSPPNQLKMRSLVPSRLLSNQKLIQELSECTAMVKPFVLFALYFSFIPLTLLWIHLHWWHKILSGNKLYRHFTERLSAPSARNAEESFAFTQNKDKGELEECNFIHSPAFSITCLTVFLSGLPAAATYALYNILNIDAMFGFPSHQAGFVKTFLILGLYMNSVGCCVSLLFFKNWFTFLTNFGGDEQQIELTRAGVTCRSKSWMTQVMTFNMPWAGAFFMNWDEVKALRLDKSFAPHYPLPTNAFSEKSFVYRFVNRFAQLVDGINRPKERDEIVCFTSDPGGRHGIYRTMKVNLSQLDAQQRARLYYSVRNWAPHVVLDQDVQRAVIGSPTLAAPRYTQLWFELLTEQMRQTRSGMLLAGTELHAGKYIVKEKISSGGQANIYAAVTSTGDDVVLKEFILSNSDAPGALLQSASEFETEASFLSSIAHPRIVKMHDFFADSRRLYLVLERVSGSSLRQLVKTGGPLDEKQVAEIGLQVAEVLEFLHTQEPPVVHRDISPDNLMYDETNGITVIDFSLAAATSVRSRSTTMGKHSYAPPEQLREQAVPQSDIYALGATIFYLLTGIDPKPCSESDVGALRSDVSRKMLSIVSHATALNLDDRYAEAKWLRLDLETALNSKLEVAC